MRKYDDSIESFSAYTQEEYQAWTSLKFYEELFHQMMIDIHNVAIDIKDEEQRNTLFVTANKLAILCDRCKSKFKENLEF